jgi:hypothetical protein
MVRKIYNPFKPFNQIRGDWQKIFLEILKYFFAASLLICVIFTVIISIEHCPTPDWSLEGIKTLVDLYYYPLFLIVVMFFIATLGVATASIIHSGENLVEARKARDASYRPDLYIPKFHLFFSTRILGEYANKFMIFSTFQNLPIQMQILNVGRAVAKSIEYCFSFDTKAAIQWIKRQDQNSNFEIDESIISIIIKFKKEFSGLEVLKFGLQDALDSKKENYIPDLGISNSGLSINFPEVYLHLYFITVILLMKNNLVEEMKLSDPPDISNFPKLVLKLTYHDIGNNIHHKEYRFDIYSIKNFILPFKDGKLIEVDNEIKIEPIEISKPIPI